MNILREHWDRIAGWSCVALGALALILGWLGVSDTPYPAEQLSYIASGGLGGIFLLGLGTTLLLSADLRDEWVLIQRLTSGDAEAPERNLPLDEVEIDEIDPLDEIDDLAAPVTDDTEVEGSIDRVRRTQALEAVR